jgi:hypothetical protein
VPVAEGQKETLARFLISLPSIGSVSDKRSKMISLWAATVSAITAYTALDLQLV